MQRAPLCYGDSIPPPLTIAKFHPSPVTASDDAIRDLNDEINKLFREKRHWENRIKELGGSDYRVRST